MPHLPHPPRRPRPRPSHRPAGEDARPVLRSLVPSGYAPSAVYAVGSGAVQPVLVLVAAQVGLSASAAAGVVGLMGLVGVVSAPLAGTVVEREYRAVHNVARLRYVECAGVGSTGAPSGRLTPYAEVLVPLEAGLREAEDLSGVPVRRTGEGPVVRERYEVGGDDVVRVTLTDTSDGWSRVVVLGSAQIA